MSKKQIQVKITLSPPLEEHVRLRAEKLGLPTTQFLKYLVVKDFEDKKIPEYYASKQTIKKTKKALKEITNAYELEGIDDLDKLCE